MLTERRAAELLIEAYRKISGPNAYVRIYDVWAEVVKVDMSHDELSAGCKWIARNVEGASLAENPYPSLRTKEESAWPVRFAGTDRHLIGMSY